MGQLMKPNGELSIPIEEARDIILRCKDVETLLKFNSQADALKTLVRSQKASRDVQNDAAELTLLIRRQIGKELIGTVTKGRPPKKRGHDAFFLRDYGVTKDESKRWQSMAADVCDDAFIDYCQQCRDDDREITQAEFLRIAKKLVDGVAHVSSNQGYEEWYTPTEILESARAVLKTIDLDPASSEIAQKSVNAKKYFTAEDDGLVREWKGRVWMNPPYTAGLVDRFCQKLCDSYSSSDITAAITLTNNATETRWGQLLQETSSAICFPHKRVKFVDPNGKPSAPLQGQMICYLGEEGMEFANEFSKFGVCWWR